MGGAEFKTQAGFAQRRGSPAVERYIETDLAAVKGSAALAELTGEARIAGYAVTKRYRRPDCTGASILTENDSRHANWIWHQTTTFQLENVPNEFSRTPGRAALRRDCTIAGTAGKNGK